uniref:Uncharacterized protein LOC114324828 n=1 Tax=Diabrotica virgifera virgifera TaxID=50390 RepID=A0A6P7F0T3_DIAVI
MFLIEEFVLTYMLSCKLASNSQEILEVALKTSIYGGLESARTQQPVTTSTDSYLITENTTTAIIRGLLLTLALCIHELFESLAVGLENSPCNVWYMSAAISAHKFVISFCIGMELVISGIKTYLVVIYVFILSFKPFSIDGSQYKDSSPSIITVESGLLNLNMVVQALKTIHVKNAQKQQQH